MKAIILKTKPYSMFRLGAGSLNETDSIIHSDTLFSAIINIHSKVFDNTEQFIELFEKGTIKISSAFPMLMDKDNCNKIFFLPKPELNYKTLGNIKDEKKITYLSLEVFKQAKEIVKNKIAFTDNNYFTTIGRRYSVSKKEIDTKNELNGFISKRVMPKTKVHSTTQDDSFYHETDIQLSPLEFVNDNNRTFLMPHFYFLYELDGSEEIKNKFLTCLRILADEGVGGERSTGKGQLEEILETEIDLNLSNSSSKKILLSLCNPNTQEEFDSFENYDIVIRGGGSVSFDTEDDKDENKPEYGDYRKKQVRMIVEGSLFIGNCEGRLVDVSPAKGSEEHKYFRNGKCFSIPLG